jgi:membrane protein
MKLNVLRLLGMTVPRFNRDRCWNSAAVISYFGLMCAIPLAALFTFITGKLLGHPEMAIRSLHIFSEEFFAKLDPSFFRKVETLSQNVFKLGLFGIIGSLVAGSFLFSQLSGALNTIFRAPGRRSFFINRLIEYLIMFFTGLLMLLSLAITAVWSAVHQAIRRSVLFAETLSPQALALVDNIFLQYLLPFGLTLAVFFCLFKFIPEVKVRTRAALIAAAAGAVLWELFKRIFAFYVAHLSAIGAVLSKFLEGTLASIIFFLIWISCSMLILLWAAELAAVLNEQMQESHA